MNRQQRRQAARQQAKHAKAREQAPPATTVSEQAIAQAKEAAALERQRKVALIAARSRGLWLPGDD